MNTKIADMIREGKVDAFLAYKKVHGDLFPAVITEENLDELVPWQPNKTRYPMGKILLGLYRDNPDRTYGVLVRGCEERSLNVLFSWSQIPKEKVVAVGQACPEELAEYCECWKPYPERLDYGEAVSGVSKSQRVEDLEGMEPEARLEWWLEHFNRCIKCYGCRDVCPVCFCTECSLGHKSLIPHGKLPPDTSFHLVRAVHMGGRCIDCGMCEDLCPAHIPLRALYKEVNKLVEGLYDFVPGTEMGKSPFSMLGDEAMLPAGPR